jgi:HAD superfamily hydrolase (TIGR01509 family)
MSIVAWKGTGARRKRDRRHPRNDVAPAAIGRATVARPRVPAQRVSPMALRARWRAAFDAADAALRAAARQLPPEELHEHALRLAAEREPTAQLLRDFARDQAAVAGSFEHLALRPPEARRLLGLPADVLACVFNLDGVLIGSAAIHSEAWTKTFDEFLSSWSDRAHREFVPFNPRTDYPTHMHGKPRLDGVRDFLASRGISLPTGHPDDTPRSNTVHGLANRKKALLVQLLEQRSLPAFAGAREYLEIAHDAHVGCAVVSASANTVTILERAGLMSLIDRIVDGTTIVARHLRLRPAPDVLLAACDALEVPPGRAVCFETTPAGVTAARHAEFELVIGVGRGDRTRELRNAGADVVVSGLEELLDEALAA